MLVNSLPGMIFIVSIGCLTGEWVLGVLLTFFKSFAKGFDRD